MAFYDETSSLLRYIVKVGDLVKLRGAFASHRSWSACGTVIAIDEEDYVTVQWWHGMEVVPNPSMEKPTDLLVICEGNK